METIVPLISGGQTGPLGITHLPRFWLKMRAHAVGALPDGYRHGNGGSDENLLTTFGIDADAFTAFIASDAPDYFACEAWIRQNATDLSDETIRGFNEFLVTFDMPDPRLSEWTARFGLPRGNYKAVMLNQLDDWDGMHELLRAGVASTPLVPLIGSDVAGPLGVFHLPRLWLKHRLHGVGRLAVGVGLVLGQTELLQDGLRQHGSEAGEKIHPRESRCIDSLRDVEPAVAAKYLIGRFAGERDRRGLAHLGE